MFGFDLAKLKEFIDTSGHVFFHSFFSGRDVAGLIWISMVFSVAIDSQTQVGIEVLQAEREMPIDTNCWANLTLSVSYQN